MLTSAEKSAGVLGHDLWFRKYLQGVIKSLIFLDSLNFAVKI